VQTFIFFVFAPIAFWLLRCPLAGTTVESRRKACEIRGLIRIHEYSCRWSRRNVRPIWGHGGICRHKEGD
jgi:hypothetical protein